MTFKFIVLFFVVITIIIAIGFIFVWKVTDQANVVSNEWILAMSKDDFKTVLQKSTPDLQSKVDIQKLQEFSKEASLKNAVPKSWMRREFYAKDRVIVLGGVCITESKESITVIMTLKELNNGWYVDSVRVGSYMSQKLRRGADLHIGETGLFFSR
ncbi:MAG: hypothetical protein KBC41_02195 [Candidatus Pacebacteria bacterium]|nr:hypothetical protein [Candidatus Paceibacterota bacterium]MBP9866866.1 hypothetical protein [Candidatus Paceibacterota bacterium]